MANEDFLDTQAIGYFLKHQGIRNDQGQILDFKNHPFLEDIYTDFSPKQAVRKAAQIGFCLDPNTGVLCADYRWRTIDEIPIGTPIIAVDEYHDNRRTFKLGIIEDKKETIQESFEILFKSGNKIVATANHRLLYKTKARTETDWRNVANMKIGGQIRRVCRVWGESTYQDGWFGGFIDGEGCLERKSGVRMTVVQRQNPALDRALEYAKDLQGISTLRTNKGGLGKQPIWEIVFSKLDMVLEIVGRCRPARFVERTDWWEGIALPNTNNSWEEIVQITSLGYNRMIDVQTSTKTFIAEGLVSHNSTTANIKALWLAKNRGLDIIYTLPSASDIKDFVSGKTNRLIANNSIFQTWTADKDSIEQKRVGANVIYFKGTWTERAAIATPADLYISDETDRSKQEIVSQYRTRLQHSKYAWEWYFSNPSAPGHGVDAHWAVSDQKYWFIPCSCGQWTQGLTMANIVDDKFVCLKCGKELDRHKGQWVKRWENREVSGYWINLLMAPWISAKNILEKKNNYTEEQFSNFVLGEPYTGKGGILSRQAFFQNLTAKVNPQNKTPIIGVDTGKNINVVVGNEDGIFYYAKDDSYTIVRDLLKRWPNAIAVIDEGGDIISPRKLREEFPHRVFLCFFRADTKSENIWDWNDEEGTVRCDRNRGLQLVVDEFTEKRIPVSGTENEWGEYWREWQGMYRTVEETPLGTPKYVWNKPSSGRCDYPFATLYWRVGMDKATGDYIKFVDADMSQFASRGIDPSDHASKFMPKWKNIGNSSPS